MAIVIGTQFPRHPGTFQSSETLSQSTSTTPQVLDNNVDVSFIGMGTATAGHVHNLYALTATSTASGSRGDAIEGQIKVISATATGRADVFVEMATARLPMNAQFQVIPGATGNWDQTMVSATGSFVFLTASDKLVMQFIDGAWMYQNGVGATLATAT
jgi:hypothetical protein